MTAGLLIAVVAAMFLTRFAGDFGSHVSATFNWYRVGPEARIVVALAAVVALIATVLYASSYQPPARRVHTQTMSPQDFSRTGSEFTRQQLEKLRSAPEYQRKMEELRQIRSAFDEDGPEATSEVFSSDL